MPFLFALILIVLVVVFPKFRAFVLVLIIGGGILIWIGIQNQASQREKALSLVKANEIEIQDTRLSLDRYNSKITGRIKNNSQYAVNSVGIEVVAQDCKPIPTVSETAKPWEKYDCETIGQDDVDLYFSGGLPAGQVRGFEDSVYFSNMPPVKGQFQWYYTLNFIRAEN